MVNGKLNFNARYFVDNTEIFGNVLQALFVNFCLKLFDEPLVHIFLIKYFYIIAPFQCMQLH